MTQPIRIHPDNPKLFEFRGEPIVLVTPTEHYGAVMNRPFRYERYLADAAEKGITVSRLFVLFRELQSACNPYSTCKPESPDYIAPFERVGPETALDLQPKFDLDRPNPEFFERLHGFLSLASDYGIIVEVVLFSHTYGPDVWSLNPLNAGNNTNDVETIEWYNYNTLRNPKIVARQEAHAKKIVEEVNRYDNIVFEICNEPGGNFPAPDAPSHDEVTEWLASMIRLVRETETGLPNQHLVIGQEAFAYQAPEIERPEGAADVFQFSEKSFKQLDYDAVNMHPLSNMWYGDKHYNMGGFMQAELRLRALRDYCLDSYDEAKPLNLDEDNAASQYKDPMGWTIHRKRAWTTVLSGAHYDVIDFSIINYCEAGTEASRRGIRAWLGHLARFIHSVDLVRAKPLRALLKEQPSDTCESVFGIDGEDYCIYLADERERSDPNSGTPIQGRIALDLPTGNYSIACYDPKTDGYSPALSITGGEGVTFDLPTFEHDILVRIRRA